MAAKLASAEVTMVVRVTAVVQAEHATDTELRRHILGQGAEDVRGAIVAAIGVRASNPEAGWLDEDRVVFVTDIIDAEPLTEGAILRVVA